VIFADPECWIRGQICVERQLGSRLTAGVDVDFFLILLVAILWLVVVDLDFDPVLPLRLLFSAEDVGGGGTLLAGGRIIGVTLVPKIFPCSKRRREIRLMMRTAGMSNYEEILTAHAINIFNTRGGIR
jgi:hypothetical protein